MTESVLFVSCADGSEIVTLALVRETGGLREIARTAVPAPVGQATSMPLALSADRTRLYAGVRIAPFPLVSFAVAAQTGALSVLGSTDLPAGMAYLSVMDRHVLGASYSGGLLSASPIGPDGVAHGPTAALATAPRAHSIVPGPDGRFCYAAILGGDEVLHLALRHGALQVVSRCAAMPGAGPRHMRFSPDGRFLFVLNELDATLDTLAVAADGSLTRRHCVALLAPGTPGQIAAADLHLSADGAFLYASERLTNVLTAWRVTDGVLAHTDTIAAEPVPRGFALDPSGRFLVCAGQDSGCVAVYAAGARLERLGSLKLGGNPNWITFLAAG